MNLDRSTVTRSGPFRSDPRAQRASASGDHKTGVQWRDGGRRLTESSPALVKGEEKYTGRRGLIATKANIIRFSFVEEVMF